MGPWVLLCMFCTIVSRIQWYWWRKIHPISTYSATSLSHYKLSKISLTVKKPVNLLYINMIQASPWSPKVHLWIHRWGLQPCNYISFCVMWCYYTLLKAKLLKATKRVLNNFIVLIIHEFQYTLTKTKTCTKIKVCMVSCQ